MIKFIRALPWPLVIVACLSLGLAPFKPQPHIWEKLNMLMDGTLSAPADIGDLLLHGTPWVLLGLKAVVSGRKG